MNSDIVFPSEMCPLILNIYNGNRRIFDQPKTMPHCVVSWNLILKSISSTLEKVHDWNTEEHPNHEDIQTYPMGIA